MQKTPDLFGNSVQKARRRPKPTQLPPAQRREAPVVTGGLFALTDTVSLERFRAVFHSGASAYWDAKGFMQLGKDVGVVAPLMSARPLQLLAEYLRKGGKVFVDSGVYSQFQAFKAGKAQSPEADFDAVFAIYDRLVASTPAAHRQNLTVVAPDVLGDAARTLEILTGYRDIICRYIDAGVDVIVPIQRGPGTAHQTVLAVKAILGTDAFTVGIPSAAAALDVADAATIRNHNRFHILGRGTMGMPLYQRAYAVLEHNPGATISCDATQILSHQPWISAAHAALVEEREGEIWGEGEFDETELMEPLLSGADWITDSEIRALAAFYGVTDELAQRAWIRAARTSEERLYPLVEEHDPEYELLWRFGLHRVFGPSAQKHLSARMRAEAIVQVFSDKKAA